MTGLLLGLGILLFIGLVIIHELGHFLAARRSGVKVEEFGIGFPPRAKVLAKKNGTLYTLNWLPLGGFVRLKGENDADTAEGSYGAARLRDKIFIMVAGVFMNLVTAFLLLTFLALVGLPRLVENQFTVASDTKVSRQQLIAGYVEPDSPAAKSGIKQDAIIIKIQSETGECLGCADPVIQATQMTDFIKSYAGRRIAVTTKTPGSTASETVNVQLRSESEVAASRQTNEPKGYLGIAPSEYVLQRSTWSAPIVAAGVIKQFTVLTLQGIGTAIADIFRGNAAAASAQVAGPVGIVALLKNSSELGYQFILMIVAVISLSLAIMNVLPIPALDGGRLFVTLLFRAIRKPLSKSTEQLIHGTGFALLLVLFALITVIDVRRFS